MWTNVQMSKHGSESYTTPLGFKSGLAGEKRLGPEYLYVYAYKTNRHDRFSTANHSNNVYEKLVSCIKSNSCTHHSISWAHIYTYVFNLLPIHIHTCIVLPNFLCAFRNLFSGKLTTSVLIYVYTIYMPVNGGHTYAMYTYVYYYLIVPCTRIIWKNSKRDRVGSREE